MGTEEQDHLLRAALASYAGHEPRPGIEKRILRRVRTPGLVWRSGWALAGLAAACVIATMMVPREETLELSVPRIAPTRPVVLVKAIERPDRFPTPAPLTREERTLLALADSDLANSAFAESRDAGITPIQIEEITIPPIGE